jgi:DNA-directed RNA polymerase subunit RPC12/RpoP
MTSAPAADRGPVTLLLSCPKCGAPFEADDETAALRCAHCGSLLRLSAPDRTEACVAEDFVGGAAAIEDLVIAYRLQSARAAARASAEEGNAVALWAEARLAALEDDLRARLRVTEAHRIHVPYWHLAGRIVQGILGRANDGPKRVRVRGFAVEHTVPAYDTAAADLRDRGLRLCRARVRPLTSARAAELGRFLPWRPVAEQAYREIDRWKGQDLDRTLEPVAKHARFVPGARLLVYRPYWIARVGEPAGESWTLVDGQFQTLAGAPSEAEARDLRAMADADPLASGSAAFRRVEVVASRCPDCGREEEFAHGETIVVCRNCHLALEPRPEGARIIPYLHARIGEVRLDGDYLPFWRFDLARRADGRVVRRLEDYARAAFGASAAGALPVRGEHLWVPAFRLVGTPAGDEAFRALAEWIHASPPDCESGKVPLGGHLRARGVTVPEDDARALLEFAFLGLHGPRAAARLNARSWKSAAEGRMADGAPRLVMVPFDGDGDALRAPLGGPRVPLLLLLEGPELDAQRASVHRARATDAPPFPRLSY